MYNKHYNVMSVPVALEIFLSTEEFCGFPVDEKYEITQLAENDFNIASISKDPYDMFNYNLRIYIDPVLCAITYDVYESFDLAETVKFTVTDIQYDKVV